MRQIHGKISLPVFQQTVESELPNDIEFLGERKPVQDLRTAIESVVVMFVIALLAQVAAAPSSASTPAPTPTAVVGTASASVSARPKTLADIARERKLGKKGVEGGTFSVAGASGAPASVLTGDRNTADASASPANARVRAAQAELRAARQALDDAAVRKGMSSEDTAAQRARLIQAQKDLADAYDSAARSPR